MSFFFFPLFLLLWRFCFRLGFFFFPKVAKGEKTCVYTRINTHHSVASGWVWLGGGVFFLAYLSFYLPSFLSFYLSFFLSCYLARCYRSFSDWFCLGWDGVGLVNFSKKKNKKKQYYKSQILGIVAFLLTFLSYLFFFLSPCFRSF